MKATQAEVTNAKDLKYLRLPKQIVPASLRDTAGMLKDRYSDLKRHLQKIRKEWK